MPFFKRIIINREIELKKALAYYESQLSQFPEGHLQAKSRKKGGFNYLNKIDKVTINYIPTSERQLAKKLALKKLFENKIIDIKNEIAALDSYLKIEGTAVEGFLAKKGFKDLIDSDALSKLYAYDSEKKGVEQLADPDWRNLVFLNAEAYKLLMEHIINVPNEELRWDYNGGFDAPNQEQRNKRTDFGLFVRSKSEELIANRLYSSGLIFLYEPAMIINGKKYYPDFVIFHPITGELIIIEHAGLLADTKGKDYKEEDWKITQTYTRNFSDKVRNYIAGGWLPGINFFITSETKNRPFDILSLDGILKQILI